MQVLARAFFFGNHFLHAGHGFLLFGFAAVLLSALLIGGVILALTISKR
jgi:hypothetical protein